MMDGTKSGIRKAVFKLNQLTGKISHTLVEKRAKVEVHPGVPAYMKVNICGKIGPCLLKFSYE